MKIGRKGFMLAEALVVSVVVGTVLVTLFAAVNNVSTAYHVRNKYYDIDSLYAAMEVNEILKRNNLLPSDSTIGSNSIDSWSSNLNSSVGDYIQKFKEFYLNSVGDEINIYITSYDNSNMLLLKSLNSNVTFSEYLDYLSKSLNFDDESYNYMIIVEREEDSNINDCYYYALKLKY